ncbi:ArsR family transcriptional regulator [Actinomadura rubrisoli]|uniref:ArsR family transcriptional regulator n=1 Tax=Actinomadura rubrisoli TaxID=2530368 RepID=A0A4R4ZPK2_9ACTN|nr:ArsR family transcriptional regulator [Actinomadura rubrisoli]TDD60625.1 ArsR family transcriptional regulator [Actinomadura rubrisoli]
MRSNVVGAAAESRRRGHRERPGGAHVAEVFLRDVRASAPPQLPILRSRLQGELLARLLLGPEREVTMLDLAVMLRTDLGTVIREVERLARAGILTLRRTPAGRVVSRDGGSPLYEPLARLIMLTFGPAAVVADEFGRLPSVREVHLFGAWAERYDGVPGSPPGDIEVLVIGEIGADVAFDTAQEAAARLGLPVHPVVRTLAQWRDEGDPFLREIRAGHLTRIS